MTMSLEAAAQAMREAMRETVKRHSLWYLVQGGLMILAGILALVYPVASSFAAVFLLGCVLSSEESSQLLKSDEGMQVWEGVA